MWWLEWWTRLRDLQCYLACGIGSLMGVAHFVWRYLLLGWRWARRQNLSKSGRCFQLGCRRGLRWALANLVHPRNYTSSNGWIRGVGLRCGHLWRLRIRQLCWLNKSQADEGAIEAANRQQGTGWCVLPGNKKELSRRLSISVWCSGGGAVMCHVMSLRMLWWNPGLIV